MKRLFILLALVFLVTGCSCYISSNNIDDLMDEILSSDISLSNKNYSGYSFYLPQGVRIKNKDGYNFILFYNKKKMYLYVDVVSYYNKIDVEYKDKNIYYSKLLSNGDKKGCIYIEQEEDDTYLIEMNYNYARIETYSNKKDLSNTVRTITYILNSFEYNDKVINSLIGENHISYKEEQFELFKKGNSGNYLEASDGDDEGSTNELIDDETIDIQFES